MANFRAKSGKKTDDVLDFIRPGAPDKLMRIVPVGEVLGHRHHAQPQQTESAWYPYRLGFGDSTQ